MSLAWRKRYRRHHHTSVAKQECKEEEMRPHPLSGEPCEVEFCRCGASRMLSPHTGRPIAGMQLGRWREREWSNEETS